MTLYRDKYGLGVLGLAAFATIGVALLGSKSASALDITGDLTLEKDYNEQLVIKSGSNVRIDLNGHNISVNRGSATTSKTTVEERRGAKSAIVVEPNATLTINGDGRIEGNGLDTDKCSDFNTIAALVNYGSTTINGGTYSHDGSHGQWYTIYNQGDLTINGGRVEAPNYNCDKTRTNYASLISSDSSLPIDQNISVTINGGEFEGGVVNVKNGDNSTTLITGGAFKNDADKLIQNVNILTVKGGTFTTNGAVISANGGWKNATTRDNTNGYSREGLITIDGGSFNAKYLFGTSSGNNSQSRTAPIITGGTFNVETLSDPEWTYAEVESPTVKGGTFSDALGIEPSEGYTAIDNADGTKKVVTNAEAGKIAADQKAAEEGKDTKSNGGKATEKPKDTKGAKADDSKKPVDKEVTKPRETEDADKGGGAAAAIAVPNTGAEAVSGLSLGTIISGVTALASAGLAVIAKIKL